MSCRASDPPFTIETRTIETTDESGLSEMMPIYSVRPSGEAIPGSQTTGDLYQRLGEAVRATDRPIPPDTTITFTIETVDNDRALTLSQTL